MNPIQIHDTSDSGMYKDAMKAAKDAKTAFNVFVIPSAEKQIQRLDFNRQVSPHQDTNDDILR